MTSPDHYYKPIEVRCPVPACHAPPGSRCVWRRANGKPTLRQPHADRVTAARVANERRRKRAEGRRPGWSSLLPSPTRTSSPPPSG